MSQFLPVSNFDEMGTKYFDNTWSDLDLFFLIDKYFRNKLLDDHFEFFFVCFVFLNKMDSKENKVFWFPSFTFLLILVVSISYKNHVSSLTESLESQILLLLLHP